MITVTVFRDNKCFTGFELNGHAGFAGYGKDIVCAAVSVLVINTINSLEQFTDQKFEVQSDETTGFIRCSLQAPCSGNAELLINSMLLGLKDIRKQYGNKYLDLKSKEV